MKKVLLPLLAIGGALISIGIHTYDENNESATKRPDVSIVSTPQSYFRHSRMPDGVSLTVWQDESRVLRSRMDLLLENGRQGLLLVFITLALFLEVELTVADSSQAFYPGV